jgi:hypothetical protein
LTSRRSTSKAKSISAGCSKAAPFKIYGSCHAPRSATPISRKQTTCTAPPSRWINPVTNHYEQQIGRRVGPRKDDDIVQVGARLDGTPTRWRFTEITPNSFHWIGESLNPDGATWQLEGEFRCKRMQ